MKILLINKYYHPGGGSETYLRNLEKMLRGHGHEVVIFATRSETDWPSKTAKYFAPPVDFRGGLLGKLAWVGRQLFSWGARRRLARLIENERPDLVHCHNIYHQLGPDILRVCKKYHLPVVLTCHDFKLLCPNYQLFTQGKVCERCRRHKYYQAVKYRCVKGSRAGSCLAAAEMYRHNVWQKTYLKNVDRFLIPSRFMLEKMVDWGWPREKLAYLPNFVVSGGGNGGVPRGQGAAARKGKYILYFGRLAHEKGLDVLLKAWSRVVSGRLVDNDWKLVIAGRGPEEKQYKKLSRRLKLGKRVKWVGFKSGVTLKNLVAGAALNIAPSRVYDNCPLSILEAAGCGTPTLGARIGGIPELIRAGVNGELFEAEKVKDLREKLEALLTQPEKLTEMGEMARQMAMTYFNQEAHWAGLEEIYARVSRDRYGAK